MSSRALGQRYMSRSHSSGGSGGGILGLIGALTGAGDLEGGLETMPDGAVSYKPATVKHPFIDRLAGGQGGARADELNRMILGMKYGNQLEQENIKLKGDEERKTIGKSGEEQRLTNKQKADLESILGKEHADQVIKEVETRGKVEKDVSSHKQILDTMGKSGIPYSEQNAQVFDKALTDPRIRALLGQVQAESDTYSSPEGQDALRRGILAQSLASEVKNTKDLTTQTGVNTLTTMPTGPGFAPINPMIQISGPRESKTVTEAGGFTDPKTGMTFGAKPMLQTTIDNGRISFPAGNFVEEAGRIQSPESNDSQQISEFGSIDDIVNNFANNPLLNTKPNISNQPNQEDILKLMQLINFSGY